MFALFCCMLMWNCEYVCICTHVYIISPCTVFFSSYDSGYFSSQTLLLYDKCAIFISCNENCCLPPIFSF